MITSILAQKEKPVPKRINLGIIFAAMVIANKIAGLDPVEDLSVLKDYTFLVPIF